MVVFLFICRYMKTSSVTFNVMIIVGCMLVFMIALPTLLTYGAKQYDISETEFSALCHVRLISVHIFMCPSYVCIITFVGVLFFG